MIFNDTETLQAFASLAKHPAAPRVIEALEKREADLTRRALRAEGEEPYQKTAGRALELGDILQILREADAHLRRAPNRAR